MHPISSCPVSTLLIASFSRFQVSEVRQHLARINCLKLKAKVTQLKIESRCIYTAEKVEALKVVRYSLEKKIAHVEKVGDN